MTRRLIYLVFCVMVLSVTSTSIVSDEASDLPYIHYYDSANRQRIIERVDGADTFVFNDVGSGEPDWSPTGRWMIIDDFEIRSTDGLREITNPLSETSSAFYSRWAPDDDVLLLVGTHWQMGETHVMLYDVDQDLIVNEATVQYWGIDAPYPLKLHWRLDGESAFISWRDHLITLDRNGHSEVRINGGLGRSGWPFDFHEGRLIHRYFVDDFGEGIFVQDLETQQIQLISDNSGWPSERMVVRWSPTLNHALVYAQDCLEDGCEKSLRLFDWQTGEVDVIELSAPILSDYDDNCRYSWPCQVSWSPNGHYVAITDSDRLTHLVDVQTGDINQIDPDYKWYGNQGLIIRDEAGLTRYDPATGDETLIPMPDGVEFTDFYPSADGQYVALRSSPATIIDQTGNIVAQTMHHTDAEFSNTPDYGYTWHSDQVWVMANYNINDTGGNAGPSASVLFSLHGTVRRELPTGGNAGFVPERAIPYLDG